MQLGPQTKGLAIKGLVFCWVLELKVMLIRVTTNVRADSRSIPLHFSILSRQGVSGDQASR